MKATATANANIALVKYWGKRNDELILPQNSNVSVNLDGLNTITTVEFNKKYNKDIFILDNQEQAGEELERVIGTLNEVRKMAKMDMKAKVQSENYFPTQAGLASSAAGGAALALAASKAAGLDLEKKQLSILARKNSGSASRSVEGGFVVWLKGENDDGSDSYGKQIAPESHWPEFRVIVAITTAEKKKIKSRPGMKQSVQTCPYYNEWRESIERDVEQMKKFILEKKFTKLGELAEHNALKLHSVMFGTIPSIIYWNPKTVELIHKIQELRDEGLECYFTIDGGPQVKIICLQKDEQEIKKQLEQVSGIEKIIICKPGSDAKIIDEHLF